MQPLNARLAVLSLLAACSAALAQAPGGNRMILFSMARNGKQLMTYEWKQRITVVRKGNPSEPIVEQVRFDSTGQLQRTVISKPPEKNMSGIRGRIASEVKENVKEMMQLAGSYNKPQEMMEAVKKAQSSPAGAGTLRLQANALLKPNDEMVMLLDSSTHLARHIDINTEYGGGPMTIAQDYAAVPNGPNAMRSMRVSSPGKGLVVNVESYDYVLQRAALNR